METKKRLAAHTGKKTADLLVLPGPWGWAALRLHMDVRCSLPCGGQAPAQRLSLFHRQQPECRASPSCRHPPPPASPCLTGQLVPQPGVEGRGRKGLEMPSAPLAPLGRSQAPAVTEGFVGSFECTCAACFLDPLPTGMTCFGHSLIPLLLAYSYKFVKQVYLERYQSYMYCT